VEPIHKWRGRNNKSRDEYNFIFASTEKRVDFSGVIIKQEVTICENQFNDDLKDENSWSYKDL